MSKKHAFRLDRRSLAIGLLASGVLAVTAVGASAQTAQLKTVRIGVTPGPHAQILEAVKPIAAKKGLDIKIIEFSDYVVPNQALSAGEIEAGPRPSSRPITRPR